MQRVNWQRTRDILICTICVGILLWFAWGLLLVQFVHAIVLLLLSMAVAFLLAPAVNFLEKGKIPRGIATILVFICVLLLFGGLFYALISSIIQQVRNLADQVTIYVTQLPQLWPNIPKWLVQQGIPQKNIDDAIGQIQTQATSFAQATANNVVNVAFIVTNTFIDLLLILVLSFYLTVDGKRIRDSLVSIAPKSWMPNVHLFEDALNRVVGNYIRGQLTLAAIIGLLAGIGCAFLGLRSFALIIGVLAFLFETIPMVGPGLASIPAILLSLLLPGPFPRTFWIVLYFIFIQMVESNILGPRIVGHAVGLHPVASILALIIGAQLFGAFGALLATPIVAASWVVIESLYRSARGETADQMLSRRRTPWVIRRPTSLLLRRRVRHTSTGSLMDGTHAYPRNGAHYPMEQGHPANHISENTGDLHSAEHEKAAPPKGNALSQEHIELLRPVPSPKEQQPTQMRNEEDY